MRKLTLSIAIALCLCLPNLAQATEWEPKKSAIPEGIFKPIDASEVLEKVIRAYGGAANIEGAKNIYGRGRRKITKTDSLHSYTLYHLSSGILRQDIRKDNLIEFVLFRGRRARSGIEGGASYQLDGLEYQKILYLYKVLNLPRALIDNYYSAQYLGRTYKASMELFILEIEDQEGPKMTLFVNAKTGLIRMVKATIKYEEQSSKLSTVFSAFDRIDTNVVQGTLTLPYTITQYENGVKLNKTTIYKYDVNPALSESLFK